MILLLASIIAVLFGTGTYLMLKRDLLRVVAGIMLIANAVSLFLIAVSLSRGAAPVHPLPDGRGVSDPLAQALTLTAIVISFGISALLLSLLDRIYTTHESIDQTDLLRAEIQEALSISDK